MAWSTPFDPVEHRPVAGLAFVDHGSLLVSVFVGGVTEVRDVSTGAVTWSVALTGLDERDFRSFGTRTVDDKGNSSTITRLLGPAVAWPAVLVTGSVHRPLVSVAAGGTFVLDCDRRLPHGFVEGVQALISPDGDSLVANSSHPTLIEVFDTADLLPRACLGDRPDYSRVYTPLAWSQDSRLVASTGYQKYDVGDRERIWVTDVESGEALELEGPDDGGDHDFAAFDPHGSRLGWATRDRTMGATELDGGVRRVPAMRFEAPVIGLGCTQDALLCAAASDGSLAAVRMDLLLSSGDDHRQSVFSLPS